jgi:short-subunit dehydrogenase
MARAIRDQVVVITGASQGIGRETALQLAVQRASVVLAARNEEALRELATQVERLGGRAEVVVTDVSEWPQVEALARRAVERFGRIDTWVNNAAISVYGTVDILTAEEMERVVRVNLLGQMYGTLAALPHLKREGGGTIIHVGSALSARAIPLQAAYVASKHGVKGFAEAVRMEVEREGVGVKVVLIMPSSINTPLFTLARSKLGVRPMPVPPVYEPRVVAEAILFAAQHPARDIVVGGSGKLLVEGERISPWLTDRYMVQGDRLFEQQRTDQPDEGIDNLFQPSTGPGSTTGDFGEGSKSTSLYTRHLEFHPQRKRALTMALLIAAVVGIRRIGR